MIFAIGFITALLGAILSVAPAPDGWYSRKETAAAFLFVVGVILMVFSIAILAWRYLP